MGNCKVCGGSVESTKKICFHCGLTIYEEVSSCLINTHDVTKEDYDILWLQHQQLAQDLTYHGNSVHHWYQKATAYKAALGEVWEALRELGVYPDGVTSSAEAIRSLKNERT